jgi:hypothetical protein
VEDRERHDRELPDDALRGLGPGVLARVPRREELPQRVDVAGVPGRVLVGRERPHHHQHDRGGAQRPARVPPFARVERPSDQPREEEIEEAAENAEHEGHRHVPDVRLQEGRPHEDEPRQHAGASRRQSRAQEGEEGQRKDGDDRVPRAGERERVTGDPVHREQRGHHQREETATQPARRQDQREQRREVGRQGEQVQRRAALMKGQVERQRQVEERRPGVAPEEPRVGTDHLHPARGVQRPELERGAIPTHQYVGYALPDELARVRNERRRHGEKEHDARPSDEETEDRAAPVAQSRGPLGEGARGAPPFIIRKPHPLGTIPLSLQNAWDSRPS